MEGQEVIRARGHLSSIMYQPHHLTAMSFLPQRASRITDQMLQEGWRKKKMLTVKAEDR